MLKKILASVGVNFHIHTPDVPDIPSLKKSTTSASNKTHPPTYEHRHRPLLTQNEPRKKFIPC